MRWRAKEPVRRPVRRARVLRRIGVRLRRRKEGCGGDVWAAGRGVEDLNWRRHW